MQEQSIPTKKPTSSTLSENTDTVNEQQNSLNWGYVKRSKIQHRNHCNNNTTHCVCNTFMQSYCLLS